MKCEKELALLREAIRKGRKNKKITQEELAEKLEVSPTHVKHIESGHRKPCMFFHNLFPDKRQRRITAADAEQADLKETPEQV